MKVPLVLATRNPGKLREIQALLADLPVEPVLLPEDAPDVAETADTFAGNAEIKARAALEAVRRQTTGDRRQGKAPARTPNTEYPTPTTATNWCRTCAANCWRRSCATGIAGQHCWLWIRR